MSGSTVSTGGSAASTCAAGTRDGAGTTAPRPSPSRPNRGSSPSQQTASQATLVARVDGRSRVRATDKVNKPARVDHAVLRPVSSISWHSTVNHHLAQDRTGSSTLPNPALSDQGPGSARPAGACPRFAAGRAAVWVSAPRGSGGRRLLN